MKRLSLLVALLCLTVTPLAHASSCSQYPCKLGNCPWYELIIDQAFSTPTCNAWGYSGVAGATTATVCNNPNTCGQLSANAFTHGGTISQVFSTQNGSTFLDNFSFQYTIEISGMSSGDYVKVWVNDITAGSYRVVDTFTADTWCRQVAHSYNNAGWKGHLMGVKWESFIANPATKVNVTGVTFWQQYQ